MAPASPALDRRALLAAGLGFAAGAPLGAEMVDLRLPDGGGLRPLVARFADKRDMILQRARPPLLETPMAAFDEGLFTPNDRFFVRWHWAGLPAAVDVDRYRLAVRGHVERPQALSLDRLMRLPRVELAAVNQCSGNSRGYAQPRVPGAEWGNGAMGNALWAGVRLRDVLDAAGVRAGATAVRFTGLDEALVDGAPRFRKSLAIEHARDGEVMLAYAMNGAQLPMLNGFPLRVIVPGWFSTYWVKMLSEIEVLAGPDDDYWMAKAYRIPATPDGMVPPGATGFATVPINRMPPRSFFTNVTDGARLSAGRPGEVRGIAFGGTSGVARVEVSVDDGRTWRATRLGPDGGRYGFRRWSLPVTLARGPATLAVRCTNAEGAVQPLAAGWNPSGFLRHVAERRAVIAA